MSYPYGATATPVLPDLPYTILQRRQGDVKATVIPITLNGQPLNIAGFTFTFSVTLPTGLQTVTWMVNSPNTGSDITTVGGTGFAVPPFNGSVAATFVSTSGMNVGDNISISGFGVYTVQSITTPTAAVILNTGYSGNLSSGNVPSTTPVFEAGQVGVTVLVIPSSITDSPVGLYPFYCKYRTSDPFPGPYVMTFLQGVLQILEQNDPNA
jgi:hypothetical protein